MAVKENCIRKPVCILGGGLTGLSSAYHLQSDFVLLEKESNVGGLCRTESIEGFSFDYAIHILYSKDTYAKDLIKNKLLKNNLIIQPRSSWVYLKNRYSRYPFQANMYGLPARVVTECLLGLINANYERGGKDPANFKEWISATFGKGVAKYFMIPYNEKQWAIDLRKMTYDWIKDRVLTPSLEEAIKGALVDRKKRFGPNAVFWYPKQGGIGSLSKAFLTNINKKNIHLNSEVKKIFWKENRLSLKNRGREYFYEKAINTISLHKLLELLSPVPPINVIKAIHRLKYNSVHSINFAVKRMNLSDKHWVYFPEKKFLFHRISFPNNLSSWMAPKGWSSISVEVAESEYRKIPRKKELVIRVLDDLLKSTVIRKNDEIFLKSIHVLKPAYIIYTHTHRKDISTIRSFLEKNSILTCGRFGSWEYLNIDHSILEGKKTAEIVL